MHYMDSPVYTWDLSYNVSVPISSTNCLGSGFIW